MTELIIKNGKVLSEQGQFETRDIFIAGETFSTQKSDGEIIDAKGRYIIPGLVDTHFHGCMGFDFCNGTPEALKEISRYQAANGVTSICPATLTLPLDELKTICVNGAAFEPADNEAQLVGIHLEGPFISSDKIGAQNPKYVKVPDLAFFEELETSAKGIVKIISLAPEVEGAPDFIKEVSSRVSCSIAHTTADYNTAIKAIDAGANRATHLYNAMPPFNHREPGVIGAMYDKKNTFVELITDGIHIHPAMVRATFDMFAERVILVSDSMEATGLSDGQYQLGGLDVTVKGKRATLKSGTIAGSASNLMECLKVAVKEMGIPLEKAAMSATAHPAKSIGIYNSVGSITAGKQANLIILDENLEIANIVMRGKIIK